MRSLHGGIQQAVTALLGLVALHWACGAPHPAWSAQGYPSKSVRVILPYAAGGGSDLVARVVSRELTRSTGQSFVVENRPGAGGNIGTELVARSAPDGYTLLAVPISHAVNVSLYPRLPFDPVADFAPLSQLGSAPNIVVVHPSLPVTSIRDLITLARKRPGVLTYASGGSGTSTHLAAELLKMLAKVDILHVPYKSGGGAGLIGVVGGEVFMYFSSLPAARPYVQSGRLKGLAVTGPARARIAPELPTVTESGLPGYEFTGWYGMFAPAATPPDVVKTLNTEINNALNAASVRETLASDGAEPAGGTPEQFRAFLKAEIDKWAQVVKYARLRIE